MKYIGCLIIICLSYSEIVHSEPLHFLNLPGNISSASAISAIERAAVGRRWTIDNEANDQIQISLKHRGYLSKLTFVVRDKSILFSDETTRLVQSNTLSDFRLESTYISSKVPETWINNLRNDARANLSQANRMSPESKSDETGSILNEELEQKLLNLKSLLDKSLITNQEYIDKKAELLREY